MATDTFGARLRRRRKQRGFTLEYIADRIGSNKSTISEWENGKKHPSFKSLMKLAQFFSCSISELIGDEPAQDESGVK